LNFSISTVTTAFLKASAFASALRYIESMVTTAAPLMRLLQIITALLVLGHPANPVNAAELAPDWSLESANGEIIRLSEEVSNQTTVLLFWATWCPYCKKLMPGMVGLHDEFSERGLEIVGVNFRDDGDVDAYAEKFDVNFDLLVDGDTLAAQVGVKGTPTLFVLDNAGNVVLRLSDSDPNNPNLRAAVESVIE
jgi:cytochrome c biogenesis protein CcmG/thiol:disulfide interchange protein DsbE